MSLDVTKEIFSLSSILSHKDKTAHVILSDLLGHVAGVLGADRAFIGQWDSLNLNMVTAAQWNAGHTEPLPVGSFHLSSLSKLDEYIRQNAGMFSLHVEPVLLDHRLLGLLCLESAVPISRKLTVDERHFVHLACQLIAAPLQNYQPEHSADEMEPEVPLKTNSSKDDAEDGPRVLIVEDNTYNQFALSKICSRLGARVQVADNGVEAIRYCNDMKFDLILMDLNMPVLDGFDATREIVTSSSANKHTPIVAVTAVTTIGTETRCKKVGMVEYVMKPVRLHCVKELFEKYLPDFV